MHVELVSPPHQVQAQQLDREETDTCEKAQRTHQFDASVERQQARGKQPRAAGGAGQPRPGP